VPERSDAAAKEIVIMSSIRTFVRPLAVALTLAFAAIPASAFADSGRPAPAGAKAERPAPAEAKKGDKKGKHQHFPIEAQKFQEVVEKRIGKARDQMESAMEKHNVPDVLKTQIRKDFNDGAALVRAAAKRVGADGTVTKEEAKEVKDLAKSLKQKAREKYLGGKKEKKDA
jgi:hypothetical protein